MIYDSQPGAPDEAAPTLGLASGDIQVPRSRGAGPGDFSVTPALAPGRPAATESFFSSLGKEDASPRAIPPLTAGGSIPVLDNLFAALEEDPLAGMF